MLARTHVCDHTGCKEKFLKESSLVSHKVKAHGLDLKTKKKLTPGTNSKIKIDKGKKKSCFKNFGISVMSSVVGNYECYCFSF